MDSWNIELIYFFIPFFISFKIGISQCSQLIIDAGADGVICFGQSIQIGGNPTISNTLINSSVSYYWSPSTNISSVSASNPTVNPNTTTKYFINVQRTDSLGIICNTVDSVTITVNPLPNVTLNNFSSVCIDASSFALSVGIQTEESTLKWSCK